ncbi:PolyA_pol domain-containing protein [Cephalotus follicularis]|uniref:PolyA_pol domain-containing protein n=1 Tax=Cephalotus follicularis TaxID=3775 RepID=A0A1Q3BD25_CEPFO|nr:PolyA_pol domain-containing protein [Cephalotus follicularis]
MRAVAFQLPNAIKIKPFLLLYSTLAFNSISSTKTLSYRSPWCSIKTLTPYRSKLPACLAMDSSTVASVQVKDKIDLTDIENRIFDRLLNTIRRFNLQTELRVAGGWVRDKLLGKDSYDIDIAIDNMLGREFLEKVKEYLESIGEEAQGVAVIASNPEQSKHLETARMRLFDMWIDFVNLRCEDYSENSRIPTMKFGTAKEDALRRDLTINSLFYNINNSSVEDLTGRGISDLKHGKIVTPLEPRTTFLDDPLRVLRAIRFGARFGFTLDEDLKKAAACDEVKTSLSAKISRERIGTEIDLMMAGNQPVKAMISICDLTLFDIIFSLPPNFEPAVSEEYHRLCIAYLESACNLVQLIDNSTFNDEQIRLSFYAALFLPFRESTYKDKKAKKIPVVNYIFKDSLKRKASDAETVINIHKASGKFLSLIPSLLSNEDIKLLEPDCGSEFVDVPVTSKLRVSAGFLLREIKDFWRVSLLISSLLHSYDIDCTLDCLNKQMLLDKKRDLYKAVEKAIVSLGLEEVWDLKPLVNGKEIMDALELKAGGPLIREWQQKVMAWQLGHPSGTLEECREWMRQTRCKRAKME